MADSDKFPIAVLISGRGTNLKALMDYQDNALYEIAVVVSNNPNAEGLEIAQYEGISTEVVDNKDYDEREQYDQALIDTLAPYSVSAVIMAGFMRILTKSFIDAYEGRMLNIHPSLLPKYPGLHTHERALEAGDSEHGLSIHFVTEELDGGPLVLQASLPVTDEDTADTLKERVQKMEHEAYPLAVNLLARGDFSYQNHQACFRDQPLKGPIMLNKLQSLMQQHQSSHEQ
ncbi:phosphoribosylglycinamide formyltransferase [Thiomicrospira sp. WB1]|uniref:phosphoribosylglycinamide formyltransferase n=1 Tax=Thiomicrospira sp. WB1 TaxID=1685380 RepID=UPI0007470134|nr:phosphoribosylglycinamide formyltransferase [Thiomicrospira sp. WB1]KUJ72171.1 phosphoribosylglycinamide formyltransferase [Thiomicrospira sp. WB1]